MKLKYSLIFGALALVAGNASAATRIFDITGATAFRASANNAIISILGGASTEYAFVGTQGIGGTNRAIFKGSMAAFPGDTIYVRASWSGSTAGIKAVADQASVQVLDITNPVSTSGINLGQGANPAPIYTTTVAQWSFSDVDQLNSERPNYTFSGASGPVGIVPFMFLAGEGAPAELNNMTDQLHRSLWSVGELKIGFFTGNTADATTVLATGRNNGSGTRATILSETQYGTFTNVVQWNASYEGARTEAYPTARLLELSYFQKDNADDLNGGNSSNSGVRELLTRRSDDLTLFEEPFDGIFVSYLTISDALAAIDEGAQEMKYNGVPFSVEGVKTGEYTLWGYQQFYLDSDATAEQITFDSAFRAAIPSTLNGIDAIPLTEMGVDRVGGDGGFVYPRNNWPNF